MANLNALKATNATRWARAQITRKTAFAPAAKRLVANKARYQVVEALTGVPWFIIAVIHNRESGADFAGVLHNGEEIIGTAKKTKLVPKGRGPFSTWEEAAVDALKVCPPYAAKNKDWSVGGALTLLEQYNGMGYAGGPAPSKGPNAGCKFPPQPSPYIWAGTDQYSSGKFVADHDFRPEAVDKQLGCAGLILAMEVLDPSIAFSAGAVTVTPIATPTVQTAPVPVAADKPGFWATLWGALRGRDAKAVTTPEKQRPGMHSAGDVVLYDQQEMLSAKGYTEVGQPDGLMGGRTVNAIRAFRAENGLPAADTIDAKFTAALAAAGPRQVAKARAEATAAELRQNGNSQVATLDSFGLIGKLLLGGGVLGGVDQSGILGKANDTLQAAQDTLGTLTTIATTIIGIATWCFTHWWIFALGGGLYVLFKVAMGVLNIVVLFRQGFLARADR
jgi:lysozyme family protein/peptidoglycan hydrolase-like protein with peptidoglycan-binding domain